MPASKYCVPILLCAFLLPGAAQITKVSPVVDPDGTHVTQLEILLQNAPNSMEPVAEPRQIRIDDRAHVRFLIENLSPIDVCARNPGAPVPNTETPPAESIVTTVAGLGGLAIGGTTNALMQKSPQFNPMIATAAARAASATTTRTPRTAATDPEYITLMMRAKEFFCRAQALVGVAPSPAECSDIQPEPGQPDPRPTQLSLATGIDNAGRKLADYVAQDFRGPAERNFIIGDPSPASTRPINPLLVPVKDAYTKPVSTIEAAGRLQALVDEIMTWGMDLHKKYDYKAASDGGGVPADPPIVPGALTVSPLSLSFSPDTLTQTVKISSGGQISTFTATPSSDGGWLKVSRAGSGAPTGGTFSDTAPTRGFVELIVTVDAGLTGEHHGSIAITGTGAATGTTTVNVSFAPASGPSLPDLETLKEVDQTVDRAKAVASILSDNNKALETAQGTLKTAFMQLVKVEDDFLRRKAQGVIREGAIVQPDGTNTTGLVQTFNLATDRKDTATGFFACVSDMDGKTPTTINIYYSLLNQDVPHWSASAGFLTSFLGKRVIGIADENSPPATPPVDNQVFAVTDRAQVQLVPMAFVNYRVFRYASSQYGKGKESELVWTTHLSAGVGVNPNTGTSQPEFFFGIGIGLNRFMLHPGVHVGRTENLGGGYQLGSPVPSTLTAAPISWSYHMAFSIGFSVRVAPY